MRGNTVLLVKRILAVAFAGMFLLSSMAMAAAGSGHVEADDFSCRGVSPGDSEEKMLSVFGEPLFDKQVGVYGIAVVYYSFDKDVEIGVSVRTKKVVDIRITDRNYRAREDVRYGATPYKIRATYGPGERKKLDDVMYYVYAHPEKAHEHLLLATDSEDGHLTSFRITCLPLTEEEADAIAVEDDVSNDLSVLLAGEKEIDTSAMPKQEPVKIRGLER